MAMEMVRTVLCGAQDAEDDGRDRQAAFGRAQQKVQPLFFRDFQLVQVETCHQDAEVESGTHVRHTQVVVLNRGPNKAQHLSTI